MLQDTRTGTPESHVAIASTTSYPFHHSSISAEYARSHHHHAHPLKAPHHPPAHKVKLRGSTTLVDADDVTEAGSLKRKVCALSPVYPSPSHSELSYPMGLSAVVSPFGAVADQLTYPFGSLQRRNDTQEGRVCTACGRNNSPEWRKVSWIPFPPSLFFPDLWLPWLASPRFGPSSVMECRASPRPRSPQLPRAPATRPPPMFYLLFPMARLLRGKGASQTAPWLYNRASLLPVPICSRFRTK